jgi:hypothetical protein
MNRLSDVATSHVRTLRFLAVQVVGAVAVVHLVVGGQELVRVASRGLLGAYLTRYLAADPRPLLFVLSGGGMLVGAVLVARGRLSHRTGYRLGLLVLVGFVLGWVGWHTVLEHGTALRGGVPITPEGHSHTGVVDTLASHYVEPLVATVTASTAGTPGTGRVLLGVVSVSLEAIGAVLLAVLLRVDPLAGRRENPFADPPDGTDGTDGD